MTRFPYSMQDGEARSCPLRWLWRNLYRAERIARRPPC